MNGNEVKTLENSTPQSFKNNARKYGVVVATFGALAANNANAAIDISPITTLITEAVAAAVAIGIGFLGFVAGMAIYKKLRGAA